MRSASLAPKNEVRDQRIVVFPGRRAFRRGFWKSIAREPLLDDQMQLSAARLEALLAELTPMLRRRAVYVTFDKDVLAADDAPVNWDSGSLRLPDALEILNGVFETCQARFAGMDVVGDWSKVRAQGLFRRGMHALEHPAHLVDAAAAARINQETNLSILHLLDRFAVSTPAQPFSASNSNSAPWIKR